MRTVKTSLWRPAVTCTLVSAATALRALATPTDAPQPNAQAELSAAVRTLASERAGFTVFHRHVDAQQRAPGHNASLDEQSAFLREGDRTISVKVYTRVANGANASAGDLAKAQTDDEKSLPDDNYVLPLREDRVADYRIESAPCDRCDAGTIAIRFTSLKRDPSHGDGTMIVETATHHVIRVDFVPAAFPKHVDSASATITFGRVTPDLWDVVEMREHYAGHVLFISGGADITTSFSNYRRLASQDEGLKALDSGI